MDILAICNTSNNLISLKAIIDDAFPESTMQIALNGSEGVELAMLKSPDLIFLDSAIREAEAFEICKLLKLDHTLKDIPVVFLVSHDVSNQKKLKALEFGVEGFLSMPFDNAEVIAMTRTMDKIKQANIQERDKNRLSLMEEALKQSETRFRALFTQMTEGFALHELLYDAEHRACDYKIIDINPSFERQVGISAKTAIGALASQLYGLSPAPFLDVYTQVASTGEPKSFQTYFPPLERHFEISAFSPYPGYFATVFTDITQRKREQEAVAEIQQRFKQLVENMPVGVLLQGPESEIILSNPKALELLGLSENQLLGKTSFDPDWNVIHEDGSPFPGPTHPVPQAIETRFPVKNVVMGVYDPVIKQRRWLLVDAEPLLNTDGSVQQVVCTFIDITDRKKADEALRESELKYKSIFEDDLTGDFLSTSDGVILDCNQSFVAIFGYSNKSELIGKRITTLYPDPFEFKNIKDELKLRKKLINLEVVRKRKDGKLIDIVENKVASFDSNGEIKEIKGYLFDITERKKAEQLLIQNEIRLRELNATKDKFFSIIAHDLRNPFNSIIGLSDLVAEHIHNKDLDQIEEYMGYIQDSSKRAMDLLINLMEWSRLQTGRMEFNPVFIDLASLINDATELLKASALQKSITITLKVPRSAPILADKAMISTVLRNLISNAIKFTRPDGSIHISVEQKPTEITISVADKGVGIKPELIEKLFRIDQSFTTSGTHSEEGTGLGLILCKEFVDKHHGKIWVESELGNGSTFSFTIPKI
jgi:two-component system sensor histidine kinase/response regulator